MLPAISTILHMIRKHNSIVVNCFSLYGYFKAGGELPTRVAGYVPLASQNSYPIIVRPHPSHFGQKVIFAILT